jgi:ribosomal protein S18 acetylase RimI-like enzyme
MLRLARPEDSRQLAEIAQEAYGKYAGMLDEPPAPLLLDYENVASSGQTYIAVESDEILGMVTVERDSPYLILRNLAVRPSCQRGGIGRRLALLVEDIARADNLKGVRLWTRAEMHENIAFYKSLDYVVTHSEQTTTSDRVFFYKEIRQVTESPTVQNWSAQQ